MRNIYTVNQFQQIHNDFIFSLKEKVDNIQIQPVGQLLVDSDHFSFIYLIDEEGDYSYIQFPQNIWHVLTDIVKQHKKVYLQVNQSSLELIHFVEELEMLLFNIKGNENYGVSFVEAVETAFASILQEEKE